MYTNLHGNPSLPMFDMATDFGCQTTGYIRIRDPKPSLSASFIKNFGLPDPLAPPAIYSHQHSLLNL